MINCIVLALAKDTYLRLPYYTPLIDGVVHCAFGTTPSDIIMWCPNIDSIKEYGNRAFEVLLFHKHAITALGSKVLLGRITHVIKHGSLLCSVPMQVSKQTA